MSVLRSDTRCSTPFRTGFLAPLVQEFEEGSERKLVDPGVPLPFFEKEELLSIVAQLIYVQHGGSGMQLSYSEVMDMELNEILWWQKKLSDMRKEEAKALKRQ